MIKSILSKGNRTAINVLAVFLFFLLSSSLLYSATPLAQNGQLRVSGLQLVNECGDPVQLRGVSSHGLQWYGLASCMDYCCISASALDHLAYNVGIDVFRIAVYVESNGYKDNPSGFTAQTNNIVQMCEERGIYALIDWHILSDGNPNTNIIYARTFWESMATAHKDRKNVIYEICNEPNGVSWSQVVTYANDIIPRIRAIDPDAVIVVGTPNWSQLGWDVVNNQLSYSNIMYAFHFYAATHDTNMLTDYITHIPIFVTEWAATEATGGGGTNYSRADQYINIMGGSNAASVKLSWCAWSWSEAPETSGMLNVGACDSGQWGSYKTSGTYVMGKVSNPPDSFSPCAVATSTPTQNPLTPVPTQTVGPNDLRLDSMTDGDYTSNICTYWYTYDDSNDCTDKNCTLNPKGNSQIVPWSKDRWEDLGRPIQPFYMQAPGRAGAGDYAARMTGVVTTTFLYGFAGLGLPLVEPEGPVNISTATGISFWCKSNQTRDFRLKINSPQAFGGALDEDMYGYVFTASTTWQQITVNFSSILFSQEGWGDTTVTKAQALAAVDTIQWQTEGQTGAPYNFDLWIDDVILHNAPQALKDKAAAGCVPPTNTPTWDPAIPTFTHTPTPSFSIRLNCGGAQYTDTTGNVWLADKAFAAGSYGYEGGGGVADNTGVAVSGTIEDTLYQSERWGSPTYRFTVPNGTYQVTLKFAEMYFTAANQRIFNVAIEGTTVVTNLDIVAVAGARAAHDRTVIVTVTDGRLDITSSASVDGALFNAIQIVGYTPPANTPTRTPVFTSTRTATRTVTRTATRTVTMTATRTATQTATRTGTPAASSTFTPVNSQTFTRTATGTATRTATMTNTPLPTGTNTPAETMTFTRTATQTITGTATRTNTPYYSPTFTTTPSSTRTPSFTASATGTFTRTPSHTASPTISETWTGTPPTSTGTPTITQTYTATPTFTRTPADTATFTYTATSIETLTSTPTAAATDTQTEVPGDTATHTPVNTNTPENTPTLTNTPLNTPTATATFGAYLTVQITGAPDTVNVGDTITVIMVVQNTGNTAADNVMPSALVIAGTGGVSVLTSPVSTASIPAAGTYAFTWTYNADSSGVVTFEGSAGGVDAAGAWPVTGGPVVSNVVAIGVPLPTNTFTATQTYTYTVTGTFTRTPTAVNTHVDTFTATPTAENTPANTYTATPTATLTPSNTFTASPTASYTPTIVFTDTPTQIPTPADADVFEIKDETAYPNPYSPASGVPLTIRVDFSQKHRNAKVSIYTSGLRCIRTIEFPDSPWAGVRTLGIPAASLAGLANGSYYYVITAENERGEKARSKIPAFTILK